MSRRSRTIIIAAVALLSACTVSQTPAPPLQGPSELALSLTLFANPDVISQDGASQSLVVVQARDANGLPAASVPFRAEITMSGVAADFGSLSARTLVTGSDGRATVTYTAPPAPLVSIDTNARVSIRMTPSGTNFADALPRFVDIRLVPPGVILPPNPCTVPTAAFTFNPVGPGAFTSVVFDASTSISTAPCFIVSYSWNFGDGGTANGVTATHQFTRVDSFPVTLTVTDNNGISASTTQTVTVSVGAGPTADFVFSPSSPVANQDIFFNGSLSRAGAGRTLVRYDWSFGSGAARTGVTVTKAYDTAATYTAVLTVTDDVGQTATRTQSIVVTGTGQGAASFVFSPTIPNSGQTVFFDASGSTPPIGTTISNFEWSFGDSLTNTTTTSTNVSHIYAVAGTYVVRLTVTDSAGGKATATQNITVSTATGSGLTADFTFSPTNPISGSLVSFNANTSSPIASINQYDWDFGDGTSVISFGLNNYTVNHAYTVPVNFTFTVRLTVHDTQTPSRTASVTRTIPVIAGFAPTAQFTVNPSPAKVLETVTFDGTPSGTVARYTWNFGDGSAVVSTTTATVTHAYSATGTYTITLTVTDSSGRTGATSHTLLIQP